MINNFNNVNTSGTYIKKAWLSKLLERLNKFLTVKAPKKISSNLACMCISLKLEDRDTYEKYVDCTETYCT